MPTISNQNSSELNANAVEFVPSTSGSSTQLALKDENVAGKLENRTGAVPKRSSYNRNQKFFANNNNWHRNNRSNRENDAAEGNANYRDKKFYRNNNNNNYRGNYSRRDNNRKERYSQDVNENNDEATDVQKTKPNPERKRKFEKPEKEVPDTQRERLIREIEQNSLECMVCCDKVKAYHAIFSCTNCLIIFHLACLKKWIENSKTDDGEWRCPACNLVSKQRPSAYLCFCGKMKNPAVNRNCLPHSCGDPCMKTNECPHTCKLLCHPGPCEVCQASVSRFCGCGKTSKPYQCSMKATFECTSTCEKLLNCGVHKCKSTCHQGPCGSCSVEINCSCYCGNEKSLKLLCAVENFDRQKYACNKECGKLLKCNNHTCTAKCHEGDCKPCDLLPEFITACPCGRQRIAKDERKTCLDPIALCKSKCTKALKCGPLSDPHVCESNCHLGECPPCKKTSNVKCRCGKKEEKIQCKDLVNSDIRCKKKCNKLKSCGNHKCKTECCIDLEHACGLSCNKSLNCQNHKCPRKCHTGNCPPCPRMSFDELVCECGSTVIYPPIPCGTKIKECPNKCKRKHSCNHPVTHVCHSEPECPPCVFLTTKFCFGKHESRKTIPCNQDSFSCGLPCKKPLKCGRHHCIRTCHPDACEKITDICTQKCTAKKINCEHNCSSQCHEGPCPEKSCREPVQVTCACGNLKSKKTCEQVEYENRKLQRVKLSMQMQNTDDTVNLKEIYEFKKTTKILECNDECKTLERNRRLDIAFKVENPNLASYPKFAPTYSDHVRLYFKKDSAFVNMVHEKLTELVKLAKESKAAYRCYSFPSMNRDKRHVIHDLAELFGVETKAYDAEPNRNIVATATKGTCWLPSMSIAEIIQRENGVRRPPANKKVEN